MLEMYLAQAVPPWDAETVPVIFIKGHESRVWLPGRQKMTEDRKNVTRSTLPSFWKTAKRVPAPPLITCHSPTTTRCCSWWNMPSGSTTNRDTHSVSIFWTHLMSHGNRWIHILSCFPHRIPVWTTCLCLPLERFNVTEYVLRHLPDTKWKPYLVTTLDSCCTISMTRWAIPGSSCHAISRTLNPSWVWIEVGKVWFTRTICALSNVLPFTRVTWMINWELTPKLCTTDGLSLPRTETWTFTTNQLISRDFRYCFALFGSFSIIKNVHWIILIQEF